MSLSEPYEGKCYLDTKRELLRSHRAQPVLVESLLLAHEVQLGQDSGSGAFDMEFIMDLCHFHQKMKWLCPWGEELIDEASRPPIRTVPDELKHRLEADRFRSQGEDGTIPGNGIPGWLTDLEYQRMLEDEEQQWDRIYAYSKVNYAYLQYVRRHPCEEVHIGYACFHAADDFYHLVHCRELQSLTLSSAINCTGFAEVLSNLKNLQFLDANGAIRSVDAQIALHRALPKLTSLQIHEVLRWDCTSLAAFIRERKETLQHFDFCGYHFKRRIARALAECKNLVSIRIEDYDVIDRSIEPIFSSRNLQNTLKIVNFTESESIRDFSPLKKFRALQWLNFDDTKIGNSELEEVILANAHHLVDVSVRNRYHITKRILNTLEKCTGLHAVDFDGTRFNPEYTMEFKRLRRRNYKALRNVEVGQ